MHDLLTKADIIVLVDSFYERVKEDAVIGPIFLERIASDSWDKHMSTMYRFWNSVLFGSADYRGNPFSHHIDLGIEAAHFERWTILFESTLRSLFAGPNVEEALMKAQNMRMMFEAKLAAIRSNPNIKPIL